MSGSPHNLRRPQGLDLVSWDAFLKEMYPNPPTPERMAELAEKSAEWFRKYNPGGDK